MKNPCDCNTCPCHSQAAILSWEDDLEFSGLRDINAVSYPLLDQRVIDEQPRGTNLAWRIRTLGNPAAFQGKSRYVSGSKSAEIGLMISMGPIIDGVMHGGGSINQMFRAQTHPGSGHAGFGVSSWWFSGADHGPQGIAGNQYVLDIGCVACDCFCTNRPKVEWPVEATDDPGANTDSISDQERQVIYHRGDDLDPYTTTGCDPIVGLMIEDNGIVDLRRFTDETPRLIDMLGGTAITSGSDGVSPEFMDLSSLDVILHDYVSPGGSIQYGNNFAEGGPESVRTGAIFTVLKDWLDTGNKTLVMTFNGWLFSNSGEICDYTIHGPIRQAESIFGVGLVPACLADKSPYSNAANTARVVGSHALMTGVTSQRCKQFHGGMPATGATVLMEADMPIFDPPFGTSRRWEPVVVLHDMGNGSRLVASLSNWDPGGTPWKGPNSGGSSHGFLTEINDAFVSNVINLHGTY